MQERLALPVQVENDANLGALGELEFGCARGVQDMVYVRLSAGIGAGLILDGRPYRGATGIAGEIGHVLEAPDGLICRCGNRGCLETVASPLALASLLEQSRHEPVSVAQMLELVAAGGPRRAARAGRRVPGDWTSGREPREPRQPRACGDRRRSCGRR